MFEANFYLVNVYDQSVLEINSRLKKDQKFSIDDFISTRITFTRGVKWGSLAIPKQDSEGTTYTCPQVILPNQNLPCRLNLHLAKTDRYQGILALKLAPGYMVGLGNVGPYLTHESSAVALFTSTDGGITWNETLKKPWIFSTSPYADLLVVAPYFVKTNKVLVSSDWGKSWDEVTLGDGSFKKKKPKFYVINIKPLCDNIAPPCTLFEITTRERKHPKFEYLNKIMILDLKDSSNITVCSGKLFIDNEKSDFERFYPHTPEAANCKPG